MSGTYLNNEEMCLAMDPVFSVITPSFQQGDFIEQTIQSVLQQGDISYEHIVVDGGSSDSTVDILKRHSHLQWTSEKDEGQSDAINKGFAQAKGKYIAWINSDDWYEPGVFKKVEDFFESHPDASVVMGNCNLVNDKDEVFDVVVNKARGFEELSRFWVGNSIPTQPAIFFKRDLLVKHGLLDKSLHYAMDYELWLRFAKENYFHHIDEVFANYRFHGDSKSGDQDWSKFRPEWRKAYHRHCTAPVSVVVPNYNYGHHIEAALSSVLQQTYQGFEIVIVDDGSTDSSVSIIQSFIDAHPDFKMKLIAQENSGLPSQSRNVGITHTSGQYILPLDADDLLAPQMIEFCVDELERAPDLSFVYTDQINLKPDGATEVWGHPEYSLEALKENNIACYCSMYRKSAWSKVGGYQRVGYEDWDFWLSFAEKGFVGKRIPYPLFVYRENANGRFAIDTAKDAFIRSSMRVRHPELYGKKDYAELAPESTQIQPLVSVIISCFNHAEYLSETVLSVLDQTYEYTECIIVNDGSTDDTIAKAETLIRSYPNKQLKLVNKVNGGLVSARNCGAEHASGEYLLFLDADDLIHPEFIASTAKILNAKRSVGFVYTDVQHIGVRNDIWSGGSFSPQRLLYENILTCTSLMRRSVFDEVGGFKEIMDKGYEDWEFWISAVEKGWAGEHLPEPFFYYRKHQKASMLERIDPAIDAELRQKIRNLHPELYRSMGVQNAQQ